MERLLNVEATSFCKANCSMCPRNCVKEFGYISNETVDALIKKVSDIALYEISISGRGEPTFHPELVQIIEKLKALKTTISVVTTTDGLDNSNYKQVVDAVDILRISVSSVNKGVFKKIHRGLDFNKIWSNINKILDYNQDKVHIHLVGGEESYKYLEDTIKVLKSREVSNIYLFPLWNRGGNIEPQEVNELRKRLVEEYNIYYSEDEYLDENKVKQLNNPSYCPVGDTSISVNFKGDMIGCFQDFGNKTKICTVFDDIDFISERGKCLKRMPVCQNCDTCKQARRV